MIGATEEMDRKESILIVDDDESTCKGLSLILGKKGYETETGVLGPGEAQISRHPHCGQMWAVRQRWCSVTAVRAVQVKAR